MRVQLLAEVDRLAKSLNIGGEHGSTCETAGYFFSYHIKPLWKKYEVILNASDSLESIFDNFPFKVFFQNTPEPLFHQCDNIESAVEVATGCFRHLDNIFQKLEEISAFELLRTSYDRANYLLTKE